MKRVPLQEPLTSPRLRDLSRYWIDARQGRAMPARDDIDPVAIPALLPHVVLVDVFHDPQRFRYRLIGTWITALAERDATGRWLDETLYGRQTEEMLWAFRTCVADKAPVAVREQVQFTPKAWITVEALLMPIGRTENLVEMVFGGVDTVGPEYSQPPDGTSYVLDWDSGR